MGVDVQLKIKQHCSHRSELFRPHLAEQECVHTMSLLIRSETAARGLVRSGETPALHG